jgi:hypothetical protein
MSDLSDDFKKMMGLPSDFDQKASNLSREIYDDSRKQLGKGQALLPGRQAPAPAVPSKNSFTDNLNNSASSPEMFFFTPLLVASWFMFCG